MIHENPKLDIGKVTVVYTMFNHLGDFVVIGALLKKFDLLGVSMKSLVAHKGSPYVADFDGKSQDRFFDIASLRGFSVLVAKLREERKRGRLIFGVPMAPGSLQAFCFFWLLKKLGALTYIVDFNLANADVLTPPRKRYIFDRHLAQAAELFGHPEWMEDTSMPLAIAVPSHKESRQLQRVGFFPWSGRRSLPEFRWPDGHWHALAKRILQNPGWEIVLLGKDPEFDRFEQSLRRGLPLEMQARLLSAEANSVPDLVATLQDLDGLITLNSSALHLAHALKLPVIVLCGSSAEFWLPEGDDVCVVRDVQGILPPSDKYVHDPLQPSVQRIEVAEVYSAFENLSKRFEVKGR